MITAEMLYDTHRPMLEAARAALHARTFHAQWPEIPSGRIYGEHAAAEGEAAFRSLLGKRFDHLRQDAEGWAGSETSPYGFALGITYPYVPAEMLIERAEAVRRQWLRMDPIARAGVLAEALVQLSGSFFELAQATMHTTGQGFMMAFQASGPHAHDRALEAVALGLEEQTRFAPSARWEKPLGKTTLALAKKYRCIGRGTAVAVGCSTFPIWNSFPGIFASLVTGNPVIAKPHPAAILPMAMAIASIRTTFRALDLPPDIVQLAVDGSTLITEELVTHPLVKIIDYTGGTAYGERLEGLPGKIVFTEKAGINSIILDSVEHLDPVLENIAFSLALYSGQMCTKPQNIFIPAAGVRESDKLIPYEEVVSRLARQIEAIVSNVNIGPGTLGAIASPATLARIEGLAATGRRMLLASRSVVHPGFEQARSVSPCLVEVREDALDVAVREWFGPMACIIPTRDTERSIELAAEVARRHGAISFGAWCTDASLRERIEDAMMEAGTNVSFNLRGPVWINQSATYSDFHVSSGNPAGNASLTDPAFIVRRFFLAGSRIPV